MLKVLDRGAHAVSWDVAGQPVLFSSSLAQSSAESAWRGGVPICAPWFAAGPDGQQRPSHGPARTAVWERLESGDTNTVHRLVVDRDAAGNAAQLELIATTRTTPPSTAAAAPTVSTGAATGGTAETTAASTTTSTATNELTSELRITNLGPEDALVEAALHTYLQVSDVTSIALRGLESSAYFDKVLQQRRQPEPRIQFGALVDRIYDLPAGEVTVADAGLSRRLRLTFEGAEQVVVWNCGPDAAPGDLGPGEWRNFVCVEAALLGGTTLAPGESRILTSRTAVHPDA